MSEFYMPAEISVRAKITTGEIKPISYLKMDGNEAKIDNIVTRIRQQHASTTIDNFICCLDTQYAYIRYQYNTQRWELMRIFNYYPIATVYADFENGKITPKNFAQMINGRCVEYNVKRASDPIYSALTDSNIFVCDCQDKEFALDFHRESMIWIILGISRITSSNGKEDNDADNQNT